MGNATITAKTVEGNHSDACVIRVTNETNVNLQQLNKSINIYPNPTPGLLTMSFGTIQPQQLLVEIYNLQGAFVLSKTFQNTASASLNLINYPNGIYIIKILAGNNIYEKKIVKE